MRHVSLRSLSHAVVPHLRLSHICPHRQLELMTPDTAAVAVELLRLCEFEDGSSREKMVRTACCISDNIHI
jgi:hypothetical protein